MALRNLRFKGDKILNKECEKINNNVKYKLKKIIDDMFDTMYYYNGVGLAAPQIGILKQIIVINITGKNPYVLINPKIIKKHGIQIGKEACLSIPGFFGIVSRPNDIMVEALNENMKQYKLQCKKLFARVVCHEIDHIHGKMYTEFINGKLYKNK